MVQYIDKSALIAEIENIRKHYIEKDFDNGWNFALYKILYFIDTLEVKEVDLEKESISWENIPQLISIAERLRTDVYISTKRTTREDFYKEVLKRFKNMKGE